MKILKAVGTALMSAVSLLLIIPFFLGNFSVISLGAVLLFTVIISLWYLPGLRKKICRIKAGKTLLKIFRAAVTAGFLYSAVCAGLILSCFGGTVPPNNATVIVLGCTIDGEKVTPVLKSRLDTAYTYLEANPGSRCILSGGKGKNEDIPEGEAMRRYLVSKGIDNARLFAENESHSTDDNMRRSLEIIERKNFKSEVLIVTDGFHLFRSRLLAEKYGLSCALMPSQTPWLLFTPNFLREILALTKFFIVG